MLLNFFFLFFFFSVVGCPPTLFSPLIKKCSWNLFPGKCKKKKKKTPITIAFTTQPFLFIGVCGGGGGISGNATKKNKKKIRRSKETAVFKVKRENAFILYLFFFFFGPRIHHPYGDTWWHVLCRYIFMYLCRTLLKKNLKKKSSNFCLTTTHTNQPSGTHTHSRWDEKRVRSIEKIICFSKKTMNRPFLKNNLSVVLH